MQTSQVLGWAKHNHSYVALPPLAFGKLNRIQANQVKDLLRLPRAYTGQKQYWQNPNYYIDKVPNPLATSSTKNWYEVQPLRDKYLIMRWSFYPTILSGYLEINLSVQYSIEKENLSIR